MVLYTKNLKNATEKLLKMINKFSKVARYKITKEVKYLYHEIMKKLKRTEGDTQNLLKDITYICIRKMNIIKNVYTI
jgi:flagellin-like hook-associated protein FlgL